NGTGREKRWEPSREALALRASYGSRRARQTIREITACLQGESPKLERVNPETSVTRSSRRADDDQRGRLSRPRRRGSGLDKAPANGVADQARGLVNIELGHDPGPVILGGFDAHSQEPGSLLRRLAFRH